MRERKEYSAGGIVYKQEEDKFLVALIYRDFHTDWTLPKGHLEEDETAEQAAIREVREEAGLDASIVEKLGATDYRFRTKDGVLVHKEVTYYLMQLVEDHNEFQPEEVDEVRWVPIDKAPKLLTFVKDRELVQKSKQILGID